MNREFNFRAWHPLIKKMFSMFEATTYQPFTPDFFNWQMENKWTLMQFTGLKDKNGKEIYEGDILAMPGNDSKYRYIVAFDDYKFIANHVNKDWGKWGDLHRFGELNTGKDQGYFDIEVIGNIYENPELLETKKAQLSEPKVE